MQNFDVDSIDKKMRAKLLRMILLLEEYGNELREPYSKLLGMVYLKSGRSKELI